MFSNFSGLTEAIHKKVETVQTTVNSVDTKVDSIHAKVDSLGKGVKGKMCLLFLVNF